MATQGRRLERLHDVADDRACSPLSPALPHERPCVATIREHFPVLTPGPVAHRIDWLRHVNEPQTEAELERLREFIRRRRLFGDETWTVKIACPPCPLFFPIVSSDH